MSCEETPVWIICTAPLFFYSTERFSKAPGVSCRQLAAEDWHIPGPLHINDQRVRSRIDVDGYTRTLVRAPHNMNYPPKRWPESPRIVLQFASMSSK